MRRLAARARARSPSLLLAGCRPPRCAPARQLHRQPVRPRRGRRRTGVGRGLRARPRGDPDVPGRTRVDADGDGRVSAAETAAERDRLVRARSRRELVAAASTARAGAAGRSSQRADLPRPGQGGLKTTRLDAAPARGRPSALGARAVAIRLRATAMRRIASAGARSSWPRGRHRRARPRPRPRVDRTDALRSLPGRTCSRARPTCARRTVEAAPRRRRHRGRGRSHRTATSPPRDADRDDDRFAVADRRRATI